MKKSSTEVYKDYSKEYFLKASAEKTWADLEEKEPKRSVLWMLKTMNPEDKICLSLACGWGRFIQKYLKKEAMRVIGVDINSKNLLKCIVFNVDLVLCDIDNLPIRDNVVDVAECTGTTMHLSHPENVVKEVGRVVKEEKGVVIITWIHFKLSKILSDKKIRHRYVLAIRDMVFNVFPENIKKIIKKLPGFKNVGLFRNKGFSIPTILQIYKNAQMNIIQCKYSDRENMIVMASGT